MFTLRCTSPDCGAIVQRVKVRTEQNTEAGIRALAYHAFTVHTLNKLDALLEYTDGLIRSGKVTLADLERVTKPTCPTCKDIVPADSFRYVRVGNRTRLCCSERCMDAALA